MQNEGALFALCAQTSVLLAQALAFFFNACEPLTLYPPAPLTPGQRWSSASGNLKSSSAVTGVAALNTGGRKYNALIIRTETTVGGRVSVQTSYFVPTLGIVRYDTADGRSTELLR